MASDAQVDEAIMRLLAAKDGRWVKVAWVVVAAPDSLGDDFPPGDSGHQLVADRVSALVEQGKLMAKGDITQWRSSEVKPA